MSSEQATLLSIVRIQPPLIYRTPPTKRMDDDVNLPPRRSVLKRLRDSEQSESLWSTAFFGRMLCVLPKIDRIFDWAYSTALIGSIADC